MQTKVLGIIGMGPRGLYALESFIKALHTLVNVQILLFEETGNFGNGQVYDLNQAKSNWMNVSERVLTLEMRKAIKLDTIKIPSFPSFHDWLNEDYQKTSSEKPDYYPPRTKIGQYLSERFKSISMPLLEQRKISLLTEQAEDIEVKDNGQICIRTNKNCYNNVNEVLLTIGHQPTKLDKQMQEWEHFTSFNPTLKLFKTPYPIYDYLNHSQLNSKSKIGIRGFGLAMIDVARGIALKFGNFIIDDEKTRACHFKSSDVITGMLIPFSLDGLPPAPKPLNGIIDTWFKPSEEDLSEFEIKIGNKDSQRSAENTLFLIEAFASIAATIYHKLPDAYLTENLSLNQTEHLIKQWLLDQKTEHPALLSQKQPAVKMMRDFVDMATGKTAISLDYCIGQVWRFCQPSVYAQLSFNECSIKVFADIITLDESTKRYSYGPPVESIQQMIALAKAGVMNLELANNPAFELTSEGWHIELKENSQIANMMIDSVLDAPKIEAVNAPIVEKLLSKDFIEAIHDDLGIDTFENAYVKSANTNTNVPIALLGRLAKGTIIGVDAIAECFGERPKKWAKEAANRFK
ncbi:FAD/NAD(P)-binding protein [uncultured Arcticibacterium sp.]|uniref:FAD/NAD(P)-binding protein n=1 Tax=uncultured Arcticibacterium sp. TaxID=2173042 RepID=UPI0030FBBF0A